MKRLVVIFNVDGLTDEQVSSLAFDAEVQGEARAGIMLEDVGRPDVVASSYTVDDEINVAAIDADVERHARASRTS